MLTKEILTRKMFTEGWQEASWCYKCKRRNSCQDKEVVAMEDRMANAIRHLKVTVECPGYIYDSSVKTNLMSISEQLKQIRRYVKDYRHPFHKKGVEIYGTDKVLEQAADTIEALSAKLAANDGVWIACEDRLPEGKINPVTGDFYEYQVTYQSQDLTDIRHYKFGRGHWWNEGEIMDAYVTAWRSPIKAYHP